MSYLTIKENVLAPSMAFYPPSISRASKVHRNVFQAFGADRTKSHRNFIPVSTGMALAISTAIRMFLIFYYVLSNTDSASSSPVTSRQNVIQDCAFGNMKKVAACKCYAISIGESTDVSKLDVCKQTFGEDLASLQKWCHRFSHPHGSNDSTGEGSVVDSIGEVADECREIYYGSVRELRQNPNRVVVSPPLMKTLLPVDEKFTINISIRIVIRIVF